MMTKLALYKIEVSRKPQDPKRNLQSTSVIDLDWVEKTLNKLFAERNNKGLDSRIRF